MVNFIIAHTFNPNFMIYHGTCDICENFIHIFSIFQGNSPHARSIAAALSQSVNQLKDKINDVLSTRCV